MQCPDHRWQPPFTFLNFIKLSVKFTLSIFFFTDYKSNSCRAIWKQKDCTHKPNKQKSHWRLLGLSAYGSDWIEEFKMNSLHFQRKTHRQHVWALHSTSTALGWLLETSGPQAFCLEAMGVFLVYSSPAFQLYPSHPRQCQHQGPKKVTWSLTLQIYKSGITGQLTKLQPMSVLSDVFNISLHCLH